MNISIQRTLGFIGFMLCMQVQAQFISVGNGSYTQKFPGTDAAGRNGFPSGKPFTVENAAKKAPPTNDWWSAKIKNAHCDNLFNYPYTLKTVPTGLVVTYIPWGVIDDIQPIIMGVSNMNANAAEVADFSDWTVQLLWQKQESQFRTTVGVGMPFLYFEKDSQSTAQITVNSGQVTIKNHVVIIENARNDADFVVYGPKGSTWTQNGSSITSSLNNQNYWSMAMLPSGWTNIDDIVSDYQTYAYVFPKKTTADFQFNSNTSTVETKFTVEVEVKEGSDTVIMQGLLPHQWANRAETMPAFKNLGYRTVRGDMKMLASNQFVTQHTFRGVLPTLPYVDPYSKGFNAFKLKEKIEAIQFDGLPEWTDSYNEGQLMNRLIQTARIAHEMKLNSAVENITKTIKTRLEDWLKAEAGEKAFLFYYDSTWKALIGYPAGHGQDNNINDHHFHWGYFIHAAAYMEEFEPGWAAKWGPMINLLVRDAASTDRNDALFPHLRNFNPYQGHCWANGFASFPQGNDQESTSESMQFNTSLIHWGSITGDTAIRNLGIYLYATEQAAIEEYWFDKQNRNFRPNHPFELVSRVWGNSYDNGTFWTADIAASYGIELYPIHGGSLYLGHDTTYLRKLWNGMAKNTGILNNQANDNLWHDVYWSLLALIDAPKAIKLYDSYPNRNLKFGISDAQTYHWLHAMNVLGRIDTSVHSNHPLAVVFQQGTEKTYVAKNYTSDTLNVKFSDGFSLKVPPYKLSTSRDVNINANLSADFYRAYPKNRVNVTLELESGTPDRVVYYLGSDSFAQQNTPPFSIKTPELSIGWNTISARLYRGEKFALSNFISIRVGESTAFGGNIPTIPGTIEPGNYDEFEGGNAQNVSYRDLTPQNLGDFRTQEYVDAADAGTEGKIVTWIDPNEWLDFTANVLEEGNYEATIRYASNNTSSGPMQIERNGQIIASNIVFNSTGSWDIFGTKTISNIPLKKGIQTLRFYFQSGGFNLGKCTFTKKSDLVNALPVADAGENIWIHPSKTSFTLDASNSKGANPLSYRWKQLYGPTVLNVTDSTSVTSNFDNLDTGVYLVQLMVNDGTWTDFDKVYIVVSSNGNTLPSVAIVSPTDGSRVWENQSVTIKMAANDLIGNISKVVLYINDIPTDSANLAPFEFPKTFTAGSYTLKAQAQDDSGAVSWSKELSLMVDALPSCRFPSANGDFDVVFTADKSNPSATFVPKKSGTGTPTCILYYSTNSGNMPGYIVKPNVPYKLTASEGSTVFYYYTYSFNGGEKNTADKKGSFAVGLCKPEAVNNILAEDQGKIQIFPNPSNGIFHLESNIIGNLQVFRTSGEAASQPISFEQHTRLDLRYLSAGYYIIRVQSINGMTQNFGIIIQP